MVRRPPAQPRGARARPRADAARRARPPRARGGDARARLDRRRAAPENLDEAKRHLHAALERHADGRAHLGEPRAPARGAAPPGGRPRCATSTTPPTRARSSRRRTSSCASAAPQDELPAGRSPAASCGSRAGSTASTPGRAARRSSTTTRAGRRRRRRRAGSSEAKLQIGLYMLALPHLLELEAVGGLYQPLGAEDAAPARPAALGRGRAARRVSATTASTTRRSRSACGEVLDAALEAVRGHPLGRARAAARRRAPGTAAARTPRSAGARRERPRPHRRPPRRRRRPRVHRRAGRGDRAPRRPAAAVRERGLGQDVGARRALRALGGRGRAAPRRRSSRSRSPTRPPASCARASARGCSSSASASSRATPRRAWIMTFHGFCARVLRAHAVAAGPRSRRSPCSTSPAPARCAREAFELALAGFLADRPDGTTRADALDLAAAYMPDRLRRDDRRRARHAAQPRPDAPGAAGGRARPTSARRAPSSTPPRGAARDGAARRARARDDRTRPHGGRGVPRDARRAAGRGARRGARAQGGDVRPGLGGRAAGRPEPALPRAPSRSSPPAAATPARARSLVLLDELLGRFADAYAAAKRERSAVDFDDLELLTRDLLAGSPAAAGSYAGALRADHGRRVPGHEPAAARDPGLPRSRQRLHGRRRAAVDLRLPPRRRRGVPRRGGPSSRAQGATATLATSFRARPEILETIDAAFADAHGHSWVALRPGRDEPPEAEPRVELLLTDAAAWSAAYAPELGDGLPAAPPARHAEARLVAQRIAELVRDGEADPGRRRRAPARGDRHRPLRARDRAGGPRHARDRRARVVGAPAGPGPLLLPRCARQPARRGRAARAARLAARRRCRPTRSRCWR